MRWWKKKKWKKKSQLSTKIYKELALNYFYRKSASARSVLQNSQQNFPSTRSIIWLMYHRVKIAPYTFPLGYIGNKKFSKLVHSYTKIKTTISINTVSLPIQSNDLVQSIYKCHIESKRKTSIINSFIFNIYNEIQ